MGLPRLAAELCSAFREILGWRGQLKYRVAVNWVEVFSKKNNRVVVQQRLSTGWRSSLRRTTGWRSRRGYQQGGGVKAANRELVNKVANWEVVFSEQKNIQSWSTRLPTWGLGMVFTNKNIK